MTGTSNTLRREGVYYFRRAIPADLKLLFPRSELFCSMRTRDRDVARRLARQLYLQSEDIFLFARSTPMLTPDQLAPLVQDFYKGVLDRENELRLSGRLPVDDAGRRAQLKRWSDAAALARKDLGANRFESIDFFAAAMIRKHGLTMKLDEIETRQVQQALLRASCDLAEALAARCAGDFNYEPRDRLLRAELSEIGSASIGPESSPVSSSAIATSASDAPQTLVPKPASALLFSERAEAFRSKQLLQGSWEKQTAQQARATYRLFSEHCGDKRLSSYTLTDAAGFRDLLLGLPAVYSTDPAYRGMTAAEIYDLTRGDDCARMAPRTAERHLMLFQAFGRVRLILARRLKRFFPN